jgi:hypothetical protein
VKEIMDREEDTAFVMAPETAFAIVADAIVTQPRSSDKWLSTDTIPDSMREATIAALNENRDLPDDEMVAAAIEVLKASDQRDVKAAGKILEWAKRNIDSHA